MPIMLISIHLLFERERDIVLTKALNMQYDLSVLVESHSNAKCISIRLLESLPLQGLDDKDCKQMPTTSYDLPILSP